MRKKFQNVLNLFENFPNSKIKIRTQNFTKIVEKWFSPARRYKYKLMSMTLCHIKFI